MRPMADSRMKRGAKKAANADREPTVPAPQPRRLAPEDGAATPRRIRFSFAGRKHSGIEGDTVASALAAEGIDVLTHSFKYHRPRGMLCADGRCPNCMC